MLCSYSIGDKLSKPLGPFELLHRTAETGPFIRTKTCFATVLGARNAQTKALASHDGFHTASAQDGKQEGERGRERRQEEANSALYSKTL